MRKVDDGGQAQQANAIVLEASELGRGQASKPGGLIEEEDGAGILIPPAQVSEGDVKPLDGLDDTDAADLLADLLGVRGDDAHRGPGVVAPAARLAQVGFSGGRRTDE